MNKEFLVQKYVEQRLSSKEIARELEASHSTVLKYLKLHGIPLRPSGSNIRKRPGFGLAYGKRIINRQEIANKREQENIVKMKALREQGYSYWKIADILNTLKIATQTGRGRWHAKTVQQILDAQTSHSL